MREYAPDKALSKGSGYWSSEGNHRNEVVSWTGTINSRRTVDAIEINWAYAPGKGKSRDVSSAGHCIGLTGCPSVNCGQLRRKGAVSRDCSLSRCECAQR